MSSSAGPGTSATPLTDLAALEAAVWEELERCVRDKGHGWRVGVLATTDGDSGEARSVVLRDVRLHERSVIFFTDQRSPKVAQIEAHPRGTLVLWSSSLGWQLRLRVQLQVETRGLAVSSAWARLKMTPGAQDYLSPLAPGTEIAHPAPERGSREFFALVTAEVQAIDWLELRAEGHRRALFDGRTRRWVQP